MSIGPHQAAAQASGQAIEKIITPPPKLKAEKYIPAPDFDPRALAHTVPSYGEHESYVKPAYDWLETVHSGFHRLSDARAAVFEEAADQNSAVTKGQAIIKIADAAQKLQDTALRGCDSACKRLSDGIAGIEKQLQEPMQKALSDPSAYGVLSYVERLPSDKRIGFLNKAIEKGDSRTMNIVLSSPAYLAGISDELHATLTVTWHAKANPELFGRLKAMQAARDYLQARGPRVFVECGRAVGQDWKVVEKLRTARSKSDELLALVNAPPVA